MNIDNQLLDELLAQAAENPRLRMNYDLRTRSTSLGQAVDYDDDC